MRSGGTLMCRTVRRGIVWVVGRIAWVPAPGRPATRPNAHAAGRTARSGDSRDCLGGHIVDDPGPLRIPVLVCRKIIGLGFSLHLREVVCHRDSACGGIRERSRSISSCARDPVLEVTW